MNLKNFSIIFLTLVSTLLSCKKDITLQDKDIPTSYNFDNVDYSGQSTRLAMLGEMTSLMKSANTPGTSISAGDLKNMFANENNPFSSNNLNSNTKNIKSKTFAAEVSQFETYMDNLAAISGTTSSASTGVAGIANSGSKNYLLNENGVEYTQLIEKGLMGALCYYQIAEVYTSEEKIGNSVDNTTVEEGKGTDMEHHWDEAFGYIGANKEFNEDEYKYHAKYSGKGQDVGLETRSNLFQAFLTGRAAISAKDMTRKELEAQNVKKYLEQTIVTTAIHYLNGAKENITDYAIRCHELSEAYAFIYSLKYNGSKQISNTDLAMVKSYLENNNGAPDFANISVTNINAAIEKLSQIYSLESVKNAL